MAYEGDIADMANEVHAQAEHVNSDENIRRAPPSERDKSYLSDHKFLPYNYPHKEMAETSIYQEHKPSLLPTHKAR